MEIYNNENKNLLPSGTMLQMGKYRIEESLGSGGFGNTYIIINTGFNERFALKEFFLKGTSERKGDSTVVTVPMEENKRMFASQMKKFEREAKFLLKLHNRHIVPVHDLFQENGTAYYVMDYIEGESLSARMKRTGIPMQEQEVMQIFKQLLEALREVHAKHIWHLDIKPGNIIQRKDGTIVLIDFGASKQMSKDDGHTATTTALAYTRGYAPAEQIDQNRELIGPWTDLFAVGATLYNLITANTPPNIALLGDESAFSFPQNVSQPMRDLIMWMMEPHCRKRPQSVYDVAEWMVKNMGQRQANIDRQAINDTVLPGEHFIDEVKRRQQQPQTEVQTVSYKQNDNNRKPKPDVRTEQKPARVAEKPQERNVSQSGNNRKTIITAVAAGVVALVAVLAVALGGKKDKVTEPEVKTETVAAAITNPDGLQTVTDEKQELALGECLYTGTVDSDGKPHGQGEAKFTDDQYYKGPFEHGVMHGENAVYRFKNEYTFEGEFYHGKFKQGKMTWTDNGDYFIGTFANGQPDKGTTYDKNGNKK